MFNYICEECGKGTVKKEKKCTTNWIAGRADGGIA